MVDITIISGFLGSGKTTFIKKLIRENSGEHDFVIIENEFGEESIDGRILEKEGVEVREINSGCICCSVSGDFKNSIRYIIDRFSSERIIIEPSGVGKLSDIEKICREFDDVRLGEKITIADINKYMMYSENFGEFFDDQIRAADTVVFSRIGKDNLEELNKKINEVSYDVNRKNSRAEIICKPWDDFRSWDLVEGKFKENADGEHSEKSKVEHGKKVENKHNEKEEDNHNEITIGDLTKYDKDKSSSNSTLNKKSEGKTKRRAFLEKRVLKRKTANESFMNLTLSPFGDVGEVELRELLEEIIELCGVNLIRAKGMVNSYDGILEFDFVPGELEIRNIKTKTSPAIVFIGKNLEENEIKRVLERYLVLK